VLSSVWPEPFGAVGLEAMRYGVPVVAFDAGGIREWLISAYNGYLVSWMDCAAFACRVQELLLDKTLARQMGERGRRLVDQKFHFSNYISGLERMFARVLAEAQEKANA
jgi:glycosyltransferase involved in cell wall biosynthesis